MDDFWPCFPAALILSTTTLERDGIEGSGRTYITWKELGGSGSRIGLETARPKFPRHLHILWSSFLEMNVIGEWG